MVELAARDAVRNRIGAGTFRHRADGDALAFALVLEPEVDGDRPFEMRPLAQVAIGEGLAAVAPPETELRHDWQGRIWVNGAVCGALECVADETASPPAWLVIGARLALAGRGEPGRHADRSTLEDEMGAFDPLAAIEAVARSLVGWLYRWETEGFAPVAREWTARRLPGDTVEVEGVAHRFLGLADHGDLLTEDVDGRRVITPVRTLWLAGQAR